ncbi:hypothetical protein [Bacterioplanoides sp.]|uniref:hypothetical protein n=1 Tax=Bacterioplanoides sp. TaxID=2066072 RepID=UPI003AFF6FAE
MLEQTRLDYLQAMGITQWMPRSALEHAPQPRWLPTEAVNHHSHQEVEQLAQSHHIPPVMAAELLAVGDAAQQSRSAANTSTSNKPDVSQRTEANDALETAVTVAETAKTETAKTETADLTPPRFELHFLRVGQHGVWVCQDAQTLDAMMRFAYRVMAGMQQPLDMMQAPLTFRWPFIESSHHDQSRAVAVQALTAQWQHFATQGARYIIAFGDNCQHWLPQAGADMSGNNSFWAANLNQVLETPAEKRRLWHMLLQQGSVL